MAARISAAEEDLVGDTKRVHKGVRRGMHARAPWGLVRPPRRPPPSGFALVWGRYFAVSRSVRKAGWPKNYS
ncbi:hypothetical protein GCM10023165_53520 [Variovorax defluvii]|uniref:Uncharacterized protein n=1 Tax=Variovorax defluvii TaxID=913761 RepID=A0ABP8IH61_9BURK